MANGGEVKSSLTKISNPPILPLVASIFPLKDPESASITPLKKPSSAITEPSFFIINLLFALKTSLLLRFPIFTKLEICNSSLSHKLPWLSVSRVVIPSSFFNRKPKTCTPFSSPSRPIFIFSMVLVSSTLSGVVIQISFLVEISIC